VIIAIMVKVAVEPVRPEWAEALAEGDAVFEERYSLRVEQDWAGFPETVPLMVGYATSGSPPEWGPHLFFVGDVLVGAGGWKGPPVRGAAEIGYAVAPSRQGEGIATAAVLHFLAQGRARDLRQVIAHTLPVGSASTAVLRRCGFTMVGTVEDPDEGHVWRWEVVPDGGDGET
jgi:RimJ/RimL family protein N-acetyltransferase